jgi:nucleoside-diphosphate-sugar epimerase
VALPFAEDDETVCGPTSSRRWAYACAKALDEFLALAHWYEFGLPVRIVRLFNTAGPRQSERYGMVVPRFVDAALSGRPLYVHGNGSQQRCFAHCRDITDGLVQIMGTPECIGEVVNLGSAWPITIRQLAEKIVSITRSNSPIEHISYRMAFGEDFEDIPCRVPCLKKAEKLIGYRPRFSIEEIITDIVGWRKLQRGDSHNREAGRHHAMK